MIAHITTLPLDIYNEYDGKVMPQNAIECEDAEKLEEFKSDMFKRLESCIVIDSIVELEGLLYFEFIERGKVYMFKLKVVDAEEYEEDEEESEDEENVCSCEGCGP